MDLRGRRVTRVRLALRVRRASLARRVRLVLRVLRGLLWRRLCSRWLVARARWC